MTLRLLVLLLLVLCLPTSDAFAQNDAERMAAVICAGDQECLARAKHRLTAEGLRTMFAVDRELVTLMKEVPDLEKRMDELARRIDPQRRLEQVAVSAQVHDGIPEIAEILRRHKTNGREFVSTYVVAMVTAMTDDTLAYEAQRSGRNEVPSELMTPALRFWRSMDPALKAEADAWKKMRGYDKGINR
jgi:hypothetical protein